MITKYQTTGSFEVNHNKMSNLAFLHRVLNQNKITSVTFFQEESSLAICAMSYLTGLMIYYKVDFRDFKEASKAIQSSIPSAPVTSLENIFDDLSIGEILDGDAVQKAPLRFSTSGKFVKALSQFSSNSSVTVGEDKLLLLADNTMLNFSVVQSLITQEDYKYEFDNITWEKLNVPVVKSIASALSKTPDTAYRQYISLQEDKIFAHNASIILEADSWKLKYDYTLPYTAIDIIKQIPPRSNSNIGIKGKRLYLDIDGLFLSFELLTDEIRASRALSYLDKSNFVQMCELKPKEWSKLNLLTTNGLSEEEDKTVKLLDIELDTTTESLIARNGEDSLYVEAFVQPGIKIKINLNLLQLAHKLCMTSTKSPQPKIYVDSTCTEKVIMFISDLTVLVKLTSIETDSNIMKNLPRLASQQVQYSPNNAQPQSTKEVLEENKSIDSLPEQTSLNSEETSTLKISGDNDLKSQQMQSQLHPVSIDNIDSIL